MIFLCSAQIGSTVQFICLAAREVLTPENGSQVNGFLLKICSACEYTNNKMYFLISGIISQQPNTFMFTFVANDMKSPINIPTCYRPVSKIFPQLSFSSHWNNWRIKLRLFHSSLIMMVHNWNPHPPNEWESYNFRCMLCLASFL